MTVREVASSATALVLAVAVGGCAPERSRELEGVARGDRSTLDPGAVAFRDWGCGACHRLSSIPGARGVTGPPLDDLSDRVYIAGHVPNTSARLAAFIRRPQDVDPDTAMPAVGLTEADAMAIAQFLLRRR